MSGVGRRFDFEAAREEARAKKQKEKIKKIVSSSVLVVILLVLVIGGKVGWDSWREKRQREQEAAEAARLAEERAYAEKKRLENERREAERIRREAERKAREEAREAERRAKEEARAAERLAREQARAAAEEARRLEAENKIRQKDLKAYAEKTVGDLRFVIDDHVVIPVGTDTMFEMSVDERRWVELSASASARAAIDLFEELRGNVTNEFSESNYPDRETVGRLLANLDDERFTLVVQLTDEARGKRFVVTAIDPVEGLVEPKGCRALKDGSRVTGWTIPFRYGDRYPVFIMDSRTADKFAREWASEVRKVRKDAAKLSNADEFVATRLAESLPDFIRSVKVELSTPPPEEKKPEPRETKREFKPKATLKGSNTSIRTMNGPQLRR